MIERKLSELTYEEVAKELNSTRFNMPDDESDALRTITNKDTFDQVKKDLIDRWGDMMVEIDDIKPWFDQVILINKAFNDAQKRYRDKKADWCARYGCN